MFCVLIVVLLSSPFCFSLWHAGYSCNDYPTPWFWVNHDIPFRHPHRLRRKRPVRAMPPAVIPFLVRAYLTSGIHGRRGVSGSGSRERRKADRLSPLLATSCWIEVDKQLEDGHCFVRYADDANVYVAAGRAGQRVMVQLRNSMDDCVLR